MRAVQMLQMERRVSCDDMLNGCPAIFSPYHVHANLKMRCDAKGTRLNR
jgi:hypothetical protein